MHAILLRAPLPDMPQRESRVQSFSFDTIENNLANPASSRVNATARDEVKHQQPGCVDCSKIPQQPSVEIKGQKPSGKSVNLDIFVNDDAQSKSILGFFSTYQALKNLKSNCNYQVYAPGDELYKQRYSSWIPASQFPAIVMTRQDGGHIYIASKSEIPSTAHGLHTAIYHAEQASIKAEQLSKQSNPVESSPDCVDGNCKKPPFFNRDRHDETSLFPNRQPDASDLVSSFFRSQGIGFESVALLAIVIVFIVLIFKQR